MQSRCMCSAALKAVLACLVLAIPACTPGPDAGDRPATAVVRDSAGIEIVEVSGAAWPGAPWNLSTTPTLDLGQMDGPEATQFFRVASLDRFSDGRIVVANAGTLEIRVFDATGGHLWSVGGAGEGPGEFQSMFGARVWEDTIFAHDFIAGRVTVFDDTGALVRTVPLDRSDGRPQDIWPVGDGYLALRLDFADRENVGDGYQRRVARYRRYGPDGSVGSVIDELPGQEMLLRTMSAGGDGVTMSSTSPPFAQQQQQTVLENRLIAGITDRFEVRVYDPSGGLERLIRDPGRQAPLTDAEWERGLVERLDDADTPEIRRNIAEIMAMAPRPAMRPAFGRFIADPAGFVWVARYRPAEDAPVPYLVIDPGGAILGDVSLPVGFTPRAIGDDWVLGTWRDPLDVTHVRLYALSR